MTPVPDCALTVIFMVFEGFWFSISAVSAIKLYYRTLIVDIMALVGQNTGMQQAVIDQLQVLSDNGNWTQLLMK